MANRASPKLKYAVFAEIVEQLVHLASVNAAGGHRHHSGHGGPVLFEIQTEAEVYRDLILAQSVVVAAHRIGIAFQFTYYRAGMNMVDSSQAHPLGDHPEVDSMRLLSCVSAVTSPVQVQDDAVLASPLGHRLNCRVADRQVDHHDHATQLASKVGSFVHLLHGSGGDVQVVPLDLASHSHGAVHRFHAEQVAVAPAHEGLAVDVLVVLAEVQPTAQRFIHHAAVVAGR